MCSEQFFVEELEYHFIDCFENQIKVKKEDVYKESKPVEFTYEQKMALAFSYKKSKLYSKNVFDNLVLRFLNFGYKKEDIKKVQNYVKNHSQIIIHFSPLLLDKFLNDTNYRNGFEIGRDSNYLKSRITWETNLFNRIYDNVKDGSNRVKYGVLNITNCLEGVKSCYSYGDSYFVLKKDIKKRSTFVFGDSSIMDIHIATFKHFNSILLYMNDGDFKNLVDHVLNCFNYNEMDLKGPEYKGSYIEVQIHGPIRFNQDIDRIVLNPTHYNTNYEVQTNKFVEKNLI